MAINMLNLKSKFAPHYTNHGVQNLNGLIYVTATDMRDGGKYVVGEYTPEKFFDLEKYFNP